MSDGEISVQIFDRNTYRYLWTVQNFCLCCEKNYTSPDFKTNFYDNEETLKLVIKNLPSHKRTSLSMVLCSDNIVDGKQVDVQMRFSIINLAKILVEPVEIERSITGAQNENIEITESLLGPHRSVDVCELIPNNTLTIVFEVGCKPIDKLQQKNQTVNLSSDLKLTFNDGKFSDLLLIVENKEINVHKVILASRSPVFFAMLSSDMIEKQNGKIEITDIDFETMEQVLLYMYTGNVENPKGLRKLLGAADKYALDGLKNICVDAMCKALTVENTIETLKIAELYRTSKLKKKALDFMMKNFKDTVETDDFKCLLKSN